MSEKSKFEIAGVIVAALSEMQDTIIAANCAAGWWENADIIAESGSVYGGDTEKRLSAEIQASKISLIHSELSEALEGVRKGHADKHLPHRSAVEVELADAVIRIFDFAGYYGLDVAGAIAEKFVYNQQREDHKIENREKEGGKAI